MPKYKIADIVFDVNFITDYPKKSLKDYMICGDDKVECVINMTQKDIEYEKTHSVKEFTDGYYENIAIYRKICDYVLNNANGLFLHCSSLSVDGNAYLFTAPSGTGKSTHSKMWREFLGDKVVMINDDKPLIRLIDNKFYVYGTPWNGKHRIGSNCKYPIKAICKLGRAETNSIEKIDKKKMLFYLLKQTIMPKTEKDAVKFFEILDKLLSSVGLYELKCNISTEAAEIAYKYMSKGE
ncbi:MAG: hypothetical protein MJ066_00830 [Clostridia bacterium]|nr:hypothetical protein [Clostridia bacterium]